MNRIERFSALLRASLIDGLPGRLPGRLTRRLGDRRTMGIAALGAATLGIAGLLLAVAPIPAGAEGQPGSVVAQVPAQMGGTGLVLSQGRVQVVAIPDLRFRFGNARVEVQTRHFATSVGHFTVGQGMAKPRQIVVPSLAYYGGAQYGCPPWGAPGYGGGYAGGYGAAGYGGPVYGAAGYGVPLYDYRANSYAQRGYRGGYGNYGYPPYMAQVAPMPYRGEAPGSFNAGGSFNEPAGYVAVPLTETQRPSFAPRIVHMAGAKTPGGEMPVVHRPAGKNYIHIE